MRDASRWALISVGLFLGACSDEKPGPIVNEEISWQIGCFSGMCGSSLTAHSQEIDLDVPYQVSCGSNGSFFDITIYDPGRSQEMMTDQGLQPARFPSTLNITNIDRDSGKSCNVEVTEQRVGDSGAFSYRGKCGDACTLKVMPKEGNWDFIGELSCDGLTAQGNDSDEAPRYSLTEPGSDKPVIIKVGNCN
ncbi:MAG: hypothetical protein QM778_32925 [Myxococcales bacterium]